MNVDLESNNVPQDRATMEMKAASSLSKDEVTGTPSKSHKEESRRYNSSTRETLAHKYEAIREQKVSKDKVTSSASLSLLDPSHSQNSSKGNLGISSLGLASTWASMKSGFQNFKSNVGSRKFLPLRQLQNSSTLHTPVSSFKSLDDIFSRLKQKQSRDYNIYNHDDDDDEDI